MAMLHEGCCVWTSVSLIEIQIVLYSAITVDARRHILEIVSALAVHAHSITIVYS